MKKIKLKPTGVSERLSPNEMKKVMGGYTDNRTCTCNLYDSHNVSIVYADPAATLSGATTDMDCDFACSSICQSYHCTSYDMFFDVDYSDYI